MLMGSQDNLLYDDNVKKKFITEFTTKLGRRSFFIFINEDIPIEEYSSIEECIRVNKEKEDKAKSYRNKVLDEIQVITDTMISTASEPIEVSDEVRNLYILYTKYNEDLASKVEHQYPITKLHRTHIQWKALKLAGALAILDCSEIIESKHYKASIEYCELVANDILVFEKELAKESYELFVDYINSITTNNKTSITLHTLRKLGYIPTKGSPTSKLNELVQLANSYDNNGTYTVKDDTIFYEKIVQTSILGVSYKRCSGTKKERVCNIKDGFSYRELTFDKLSTLLVNDTAYSPFKFIDGIRSVDTVSGSCKWLALDIDNSTITDVECHNQLSEINHHICRTSNHNNEFKFRLLVELDAEVNISNDNWRKFIREVGNELGLNLDVLPKSQIYLGYAMSKDSLLSVIDGTPLSVKPILDSMSIDIDTTYSELSKSKANMLLNNPEETFYKAYNAKQGEGSRRLMITAYHAKKLGADKEYIINLMRDINSKWYNPMPEHRLESTIISQIKRWS